MNVVAYALALELSKKVVPKTFNAWAARSNMQTARTALGVAAINGKIYAVGGYTGTVTAIVEAFDPVTGIWTARASMPDARRDFACVAPGNGKLYVIGGRRSSSGEENNYEYDPSTNTWASRASFPRSHYAVAGAAPGNGKLYVFGGLTASGGSLSITDEYDPSTNTWVRRASAPSGRAWYGAVGGGGNAYRIGGWSALGNNPVGSTNTIEEYDPVTNSWTTKAPMTISRYSPACAYLNGKVYAIGGACFTADNGDTVDAQVVPNVEEFDPVTNTWRPVQPLNKARRRLGAAAVNDKIYAVGGEDADSTRLANVEEYDPNSDVTALFAPLLGVLAAS